MDEGRREGEGRDRVKEEVRKEGRRGRVEREERESGGRMCMEERATDCKWKEEARERRMGTVDGEEEDE